MFDPTTIGAALSSAKAIIDLLKNANDAQLALKISHEVSNLQGRLIDVQRQTMDLQTENHELREEILQLKSQMAETVQAEACPRCHQKSLHVASSAPDRLLGVLGVSQRNYECRSCGFTENRKSD